MIASNETWQEPYKWNRTAGRQGYYHRVFAGSMCDVFEDRPELKPWRSRLFVVIGNTPNLNWLLLTKRVENAATCLAQWGDVNGENANPQLVRGPEATRKSHPSGRGQMFADYLESLGEPPPGAAYPTFDWMEGPRWWSFPFCNLRLGISVSTQADLDRSVPSLLRAKKQNLCYGIFLSIEPLLEKIVLGDSLLPGGIDWVIVGGESGSFARPMNAVWVRSLRDECVDVGVPFFFKQWGEWLPHSQAQYHGGHYSMKGYKFDDDNLSTRVGKKTAGRLLDGQEWNQFPFP